MPAKTSLHQTRGKFAALLRHPLVWLGAVVVLAVVVFVTVSNLGAKKASPAGSDRQPADLFMQSVVDRDGNLGWHQLCPSLQSQIPLTDLISQVRQQRIAEDKQHMSFKLNYISEEQNSQGGHVKIYVVVAYRPGGWFSPRTYIITTQADGCVAGIATS